MKTRMPFMLLGASIVLLYLHITGAITEHSAFCWLVLSIYLLLSDKKK